MNNSRKYAEDLVGALKTEHYNTQRDVANKVYNTNWQNLENQYKNLQEKLEAKRQENNRAFAKGLVETAESGYDMARANAQNLANRGLTASGVQNLAQQANTATKGQQVLGLLDKITKDTEVNLEKLSDATSTMAKEEAKLNANLADTLGDIGAAQTNAQMSYNAGLADIAGAKDARDMENELAKMQREAQAAANARSRSGNDGVNTEIEDFYKKQAIVSVLSGVDPVTGEAIDWDDNQKANALQILFGVSNAKDVVNAFNHNQNLVTDVQERKDTASNNLVKMLFGLSGSGTELTDNIALSSNGLSEDEIKQFYDDRDKFFSAFYDGKFSDIADAIESGNAEKLGVSADFMDLFNNTLTEKQKDNLLKYAKGYNKAYNNKLPINSYKDLDMLFYE